MHFQTVRCQTWHRVQRVAQAVDAVADEEGPSVPEITKTQDAAGAAGWTESVERVALRQLAAVPGRVADHGVFRFYRAVRGQDRTRHGLGSASQRGGEIPVLRNF